MVRVVKGCAENLDDRLHYRPVSRNSYERRCNVRRKSLHPIGYDTQVYDGGMVGFSVFYTLSVDFTYSAAYGVCYIYTFVGSVPSRYYVLT